MQIVNPKLTWRKALYPISPSSIQKLVQHHMAHSTGDIHTIHAMHLRRDPDRNGVGTWAGIGYNYWIAKSGTIYEGRGMNHGAHARGWNSKSLGIGYQGDFRNDEMTDAQVKSGAWLNVKLIRDLGLTINDVIGHRDIGSTECPSKYFRWMDLINEMTALLGGEGGTIVFTRVLVQGLTGNDVRQLQQFLHGQGFGNIVGTVDGSFGPKTHNAVVAFQRANGLTGDGSVGPKTQARIMAIVNAQNAPAPEPPKAVPTVPKAEYDKIMAENGALRQEISKYKAFVAAVDNARKGV